MKLADMLAESLCTRSAYRPYKAIKERLQRTVITQSDLIKTEQLKSTARIVPVSSRSLQLSRRIIADLDKSGELVVEKREVCLRQKVPAAQSHG
jgi:hypothetical protein